MFVASFGVQAIQGEKLRYFLTLGAALQAPSLKTPWRLSKFIGGQAQHVDTSRAAPGVVVAWWSACGSTADELLRAVGRGRFLTNFCVTVWRPVPIL